MKSSVLKILLILSLAGFAGSTQAVVVYTENFESSVVGVEWTTNTGSLVVDTAPGGQNILGANDSLAELLFAPDTGSLLE